MPEITAEEAKAAVESVATLHTEFKAYAKRADEEKAALGTELGDTKSALVKVNTDLDDMVAKAQKYSDELAAEVEARKALETEFRRPGGPGNVISLDEAKANRTAYIRTVLKTIMAKAGAEVAGVTEAEMKGFTTLTPDVKAFFLGTDEAKALNVGTDTAGGYLAPPEFVLEILKTITEYSPMRELARVRNTIRDRIQIPKRTGQFAAVWASEMATRSETTGLTFGLEDMPVHEVYALVDVTTQMIEDSAFDIEAFLREEAAEQFAVAEATAFISGDGVGRPEGILNGGLTSVNSGHATELTAAGLISLFYTLKDAYARNATWLAKRATIGVIRRMVDGQGQYLWQPGLAAGQPSMLLGAPVREATDLTGPSTGETFVAATKALAFGDFRRGYLIGDRIAMSLLRDQYTQATSGAVRFLFRKRIGGQVVQSEAILLQNVAA